MGEPRGQWSAAGEGTHGADGRSSVTATQSYTESEALAITTAPNLSSTLMATWSAKQEERAQGEWGSHLLAEGSTQGLQYGPQGTK